MLIIVCIWIAVKGTGSATHTLRLQTKTDELYVYFFDVGQGDAILFYDDSASVLFDAGPQISEDELMSSLELTGLDSLDCAVFTHPHEDHIGGGDAVVERYNPDEILMPDRTEDTSAFRNLLTAIDENGSSVTIAKSGDTYNYGEITLEILSPGNHSYPDANENSIVARVIYGDTSFMMTGDAGKYCEKLIASEYSKDELASDVLKVGHHGSSYSTGDDFFFKVLPEISVISVGASNNYGHPNIKTLEKLTAYCDSVLRTDEDGTVILKSDGEAVSCLK